MISDAPCVLRTGQDGPVVKWDAFFGRKREARDREREEIRDLIQRIEKKAPIQYRKDRTDIYYNYSQIRAYVRPLRLLLGAVADRETLAREEGKAVRTLFLRLRDFYDVRGRLSMDEAILDLRLRRKLAHLLLVFHDRKDIAGDRLSAYLETLQDE